MLLARALEGVGMGRMQAWVHSTHPAAASMRGVAKASSGVSRAARDSSRALASNKWPAPAWGVRGAWGELGAMGTWET